MSGLPKGTVPAVEPLLDRLAGWKPTIVAIEALPGIQCELFRRSAAIYGSLAEDYCCDPAPAARATGLDGPAATAEAARLLAAWPAQPAAARRRHLAAVLLAADEPASALVQWLRLAPNERGAGDDLDPALVARLGELEASRNENYCIGAALAARLGLERVYPVDDHAADTALPDEAAFGKAIEAAWANAAAGKRRVADDALMKQLPDPRRVLAVYRAYNSSVLAKIAIASDFGAALTEPSPQHFGRSYVAGWEARNLRMVANIRQATRDLPGARVLAIVGASHKGYYERYLALLHDVRVANSAALLR